jgi:hypothetical protein
MTSTRMTKGTVGMFLTMVGALGAALALSNVSCGGGDDSCKVGSESCACTGGGACDPGLSCLSNRCVKGGAPAGGAGMGGTSTPAAPDLSAFTGTWKYTTGTEVANCGAQNFTEQLSGNFKIEKGTDAPLVIIDDSCVLKMDPSGTTATLRAGQTCTEVTMGNSATLMVNAGSMVVTGTTATINHSGNLTLILNGASVACRYTVNGTAMKIAN